MIKISNAVDNLISQHAHHLVVFMWSRCKISALTRGVAVAVSAMMGTPGNFCRSSLNRL